MNITRKRNINMLENLQTDATIDGETDTLGGFILDTDVYPMAIDMAYMDTSKGGAISLNLNCRDQNGKQVRETLWMTSGQAKGCNNFYTDQNGKKHYLPGFNMANAIAQLSIGKEIGAVSPEKKTIKVYDFTQRKEVPMEKEVLTELIGAEITLGVVRQVVDKNVKDGNGKYVPSGETREENVIDKVFRTKDGLTSAEIRAEETEPQFMDAWVKKNKGVTRQRAKGAAAASVGAPAGGDTPSIFGGDDAK